MKRLLLGVLTLLAIAAAVAAAVYLLIFRPTAKFYPPRIVTIRPGDSVRLAARKLTDAGVVRTVPGFIAYAELSGQASKLKPGDYEFHGGEGIPAVLQHLVNGDFIVVTVAIPEGLTVHQIGERLAAAGLVCASDFDRAAVGGRIPRSLGLGPLGVEGFLFPATYRFSPRVDADLIVAAMLERFNEVLTPAVEERMFSMGLDVRQLVTMASIVEKEAKVPGERPTIAGVFYNRLGLGMPLQSDPTAQYNAEGDTAPAAVAVHATSAFNTYTISGLPPGPIANPGLSSIRAALYPARTEYLYFVARDDGTHVFSRSFREHQRAIQDIRRAAAHAHRSRG